MNPLQKNGCEYFRAIFVQPSQSPAYQMM